MDGWIDRETLGGWRNGGCKNEWTAGRLMTDEGIFLQRMDGWVREWVGGWVGGLVACRTHYLMKHDS